MERTKLHMLHFDQKERFLYLLIYYNELDQELNGKERQTVCVNEEAMRKAYDEISKIGAKVGEPSVRGNLQLPTKEESDYELRKYNRVIS